jgi:hypothetical protein
MKVADGKRLAKALSVRGSRQRAWYVRFSMRLRLGFRRLPVQIPHNQDSRDWTERRQDPGTGNT